MATKSQAARSEQQRENGEKKRKAATAGGAKDTSTSSTRNGLKMKGPKERGQAKTRADAGATYAYETVDKKSKRPSRKSTRASANRAKADTNLTLRAERRESSPDNRYREAKGKATKVGAARPSKTR